MIRSMTAFGSARAESTEGTLTVEFRTVNSRFLDVTLRIPDDLRFAEAMIREQLGLHVKRGKVEVRVNYTRADKNTIPELNAETLQAAVHQLELARRYIPDTQAPRLQELLNLAGNSAHSGFDPEIWLPMCLEATQAALKELHAGREREGQRLAGMMNECAEQIRVLVEQVDADMPALLVEHQAKITTRLKEALTAASPDGFALISGEELSARIAQEASLFGLRIDVAEELARLRSHLQELVHILGNTAATGKNTGSAGKRLDFLFQEMNREANTLGSKAGSIQVTKAAIDLKLLIEQMREQAQNIE